MAIGFDNAASGNTTSQTLTLSSFVVGAGSDKALFVGVGIRGIVSGQNVTGITWNGSEGFSRVGTQEANGIIAVELWELVNPTAATADIVITLSGSPGSNQIGGVISLTGVDQTTPSEASAQANGSGTSSSVSVTTVTDNAWALDVVNHRNDTDITEGGSQTNRWEEAFSTSTIAGGSTDPVSPAAPHAMTWSWATSHSWAAIAASVKPASAGGGLVIPVAMDYYRRLRVGA